MEFLESQDQAVVNQFFSLAQRTPWLRHSVIIVTDLGKAEFLTGVVLGATIVLFATRRCRTALVILLTFLGGMALVEGPKALVKRPRPNLVSVPHTYSFPSGHAVLSAAVYSALVLAGAPLVPRERLRRLLFGLCLLLAFLIGLSRLYLCQHYLTDVIAGWSIGLAWALICHALDAPWTTAPGARPGKTGLLLVCFLAMGTFFSLSGEIGQVSGGTLRGFQGSCSCVRDDRGGMAVRGQRARSTLATGADSGRGAAACRGADVPSFR
jgi:membrane-associated phospholipid phosphatase